MLTVANRFSDITEDLVKHSIKEIINSEEISENKNGRICDAYMSKGNV
jgi:hypothetical protein